MILGRYLVIGCVILVAVFAVIVTTQNFSLKNFDITSLFEKNPETVYETKKLHVALVTDGLWLDGGWGTAAFNAGKHLESQGYAVTYAENVGSNDMESILRKYANDGHGLIIAYSFIWNDPVATVAKEFPNTKFVVMTGLVDGDNVASIFPMQQEGSFLLGALAAMMSKTGVIGYVGGDQYPNLINLFEGYKQGAKMINPEIKIVGTYLDGEWNNPAKGKEAALTLINKNADVLLQVADTSGNGVIRAAKENGIFALGSVSDQNRLAPDTVLCSFIIDNYKAFDFSVKMVEEDKFQGVIFKPGIEAEQGTSGDGIVYLAPFHDLESKVPDAIKIRLQQLTQDVIDKKILVPERYEATP
jgi:basic membrane protein A